MKERFDDFEKRKLHERPEPNTEAPNCRPQEKKCVAGCVMYHGGEIKHHKDCPFYPESRTKMYDDLKEENRKLKFMIDNGLGWEDLKNNISYPNDIE